MIRSTVARLVGFATFVAAAVVAAACSQATATPAATTPSAPGATAPAPAPPEAGAPAAPAAPAGQAARGGAAKPAAAPAAATKFATAADGTRIAYEVTGTGPALMLLHGGGQTRAAWKDGKYVERLAKGFTVITVDQRGFGESGKPWASEAYALDTVLADYTAVADAAAAKRFHVLGFGHGGSIARYLAARSDRVISAVVWGAPMGPAVEEPIGKAMLGMRAKWLPLIKQQQAGKADLSGLSAGDRSAWDNGIGTTALALGALAEYPPLDPSAIKVPTLWLVGASDESGIANVKQFEGKLGTAVKVKQLSGLNYSDAFPKVDVVLAEVEPFLKANAGSN